MMPIGPAPVMSTSSPTSGNDSAVCVALFFGGWHFPGLGGGVDQSNAAVTNSVVVAILRSGVFFIKTLIVVFIFMWVRWSLPRFRFDQLMDIA